MKSMKWWLLLTLVFLLAGSLVTIGACGDDDDDDDDDVVDDDDDVADDDDDDDDDDAVDDDDDDDVVDDDDDDCNTDVEEVCDYIFENCDDQWGWTSIEDCYSLFMTDCLDEASYFLCTCNCYDYGDCDNFGACEAACWAAACEG